MIVYWLGCFASVIMAWLGTNALKGRYHKQAVIFYSALPLVLIAALRYDVGMDYMYTYVPYYNSVEGGFVSGNSRLEVLYHLLNELAVFLGGGYELVFLLSAVIFFIPLFQQIFRDSPYPALSIFLLVAMGYYFVFFNVMRQMLGCAILLFSIRYIEKKRFLPFLACILIAAGFHKACLVFIVMYWIGRIRLTPVWAFSITGIVLLLSPLISQLIRFVISLVPYGVYFSSVFDTGETAYVMLAINLVLLIFASVVYKDNPRYRIYYNLQILSVWVTAYSGEIVLFLRLLWIFGLPSVISLPLAIDNIPNAKTRKMITAVVGLLYFLYMFYTIGLQNSSSVLPYQTVIYRW